MGVETILFAPRHAATPATPAMTDDSQLAFTLPSVSRKKVTAAFDGGRPTPELVIVCATQSRGNRKRGRELRLTDAKRSSV